MLPQHVPLLVDRRQGRRREAVQECERLPKDPGIADRPPGHADAVDAGLGEHRHAGLGREQIPGTDHGAVAGVPLDRAQEAPVARADIPLLDRAAVHGDRRGTTGEGAVENRPEVVPALGRVIEAATHLERHRDSGRHRVPHPTHDLERRRGLREQEAAPAAAQDLLHRAAEVDVDHVVALRHEPAGRRGEIVGVRPHQLAADGVLFLGQRESGGCLMPPLGRRHELIEQHLAQRVGRTVSPGEHPHRPVAVARERRLHERRRERHAADRKRASLQGGGRRHGTAMVPGIAVGLEPPT